MGEFGRDYSRDAAIGLAEELARWGADALASKAVDQEGRRRLERGLTDLKLAMEEILPRILASMGDDVGRATDVYEFARHLMNAAGNIAEVGTVVSAEPFFKRLGTTAAREGRRAKAKEREKDDPISKAIAEVLGSIAGELPPQKAIEQKVARILERDDKKAATPDQIRKRLRKRKFLVSLSE
jgi:hypothetical protein